MPSAISPAPGLQKQPVAQRDPPPRGARLDQGMVDEAPFGVEEVHGHGAAARRARNWPVELDHGQAARMTQRDQLVDQPAGERDHPVVDAFDADRLDQVEAERDRRDAGVVERAVLEGRLAVGQRVPVSLHRATEMVPPANQGGAGERARSGGRSARRPRSGSRRSCRRRGPGSRLVASQVEAIAGHEGGRVEQHVPAVGVGTLDPLQRVLHTGEVGLAG